MQYAFSWPEQVFFGLWKKRTATSYIQSAVALDKLVYVITFLLSLRTLCRVDKWNYALTELNAASWVVLKSFEVAVKKTRILSKLNKSYENRFQHFQFIFLLNPLGNIYFYNPNRLLNICAFVRVWRRSNCLLSTVWAQVGLMNSIFLNAFFRCTFNFEFLRSAKQNFIQIAVKIILYLKRFNTYYCLFWVV